MVPTTYVNTLSARLSVFIDCFVDEVLNKAYNPSIKSSLVMEYGGNGLQVSHSLISE